ncbi:MAG: hypothetical protein WC796_03650 [Candidatus Pacearchaeota archaeon]|jgi:hypothetical protein
MLEPKDKILGIMSILFALSAISLAVSQSFEAKATNNLLNTIIQFDTSGYVSDVGNVNNYLMSQNSLNTNSELALRNYFCSFTLVYKDTQNPNQNFLVNLSEECINLSKLEYYANMSNSLLDNSYYIKNLSASINPFKSYEGDLKEFQNNQSIAFYTQMAGWVLFIMGLFLFSAYWFIDKVKLSK